jgi:CheY-like chemotaxis protein
MLLDMHLPDGNGIELLQRLRAQPALRGVPAIAVSADALPEDIRAAIAAGFDAYWTKPLDMERVLRELDKRLGGQAAAPPTRP